jgi:phenylalanyl-tRNA synthetase beta chain
MIRRAIGRHKPEPPRHSSNPSRVVGSAAARASISPVDWDLALLLPAEVTSGAVRELARKVGGGILKEIGVFDVYRDKSMPSGVRSVAIRLRFQAEDRTLKDLEVDEVVQKIIGAFQEELHVGIRGQKG